MENLEGNLILEKNKVASTFPWIILLEAEIDTEGTKIFLCKNNEDLVFNNGIDGSQTYIAFPFDVDAAKQVTKGQIPSLELRVSNVTLSLQSYIEEGEGLVGNEFALRLVYVDTTTNPYTLTEALGWTYNVLGCKSTTDIISFTLGAPNPLYKRFPLYRYIASHCNWVFGGAECNFTWDISTWTAKTNYFTGDLVYLDIGGTSYTARCKISGISGNVVTFTSTRQDRIHDDTCTWIINNKKPWVANSVFLENEIIDVGTDHLYRVSRGTDEIIGSNGKNYYKKTTLNASLATTVTAQPIVGTNWNTYFELGGSNGVEWEDGITYTARKTGSVPPTWPTILFKTVTDNDIIWIEGACKRTLANCKAFNMANRYGGHPGMEDGGIRIGSII